MVVNELNDKVIDTIIINNNNNKKKNCIFIKYIIHSNKLYSISKRLKII